MYIVYLVTTPCVAALLYWCVQVRIPTKLDFPIKSRDVVVDFQKQVSGERMIAGVLFVCWGGVGVVPKFNLVLGDNSCLAHQSWSQRSSVDS